MAFVSKVTAERRDLRELEHLMFSEEDIGDDADNTDSPQRFHRMPLGIEASGQFAQYVRCCAIVIIDSGNSSADPSLDNNDQQQPQPHATSSDAGGGREIWIGNQDGEIHINLAVDGSPSYHDQEENGHGHHHPSRRMINAFHGTFPTAVGQITFRDVWVCFQDGMIRAFDISTLKPRFEMRRHCGAVTGIEVVESANIVATCSEDFLIYIWEGPPRSRQSKPSTELPKLIGKFAGHTNYVRAMCASPSGHHLFTGSADGTVRCYDLGRHVPLTVTDVVESNVAVLGRGSESLQCTRNARDVFYLFLHDVGSMLGVVTKTAVTIYVIQNSSVHCIFEANNTGADKSVTFCAALYTESTGQLWVSRSDGLIAVYDLHTFELSGTIDAHMNTVVQLIQFATCAATVRVVAASSTSICAKDSNSDVGTSNQQARDDMEKLVAVFKAQRGRRQAAERDLSTMKRQLLGLQNYDNLFQERISESLLRSNDDLAQSRALQRVRFFVLKRKHQNQARLCAIAMDNKNKDHLCARYFHDWFRLYCSRKTDSAKRCVHNAVTRMTERSLQSRYLQRGLATLRREMNKERQNARATLLGQLFQLRRVGELFGMWRRWMLLRAQVTRRSDFSSMTLRYNAQLARSAAWTSLYVGAHNARNQAVRKRLATAICSVETRNLLRIGYEALKLKRQFACRKRNAVLVSKKLEKQTAQHVRSAYFGPFWRLIRLRRQQALEKQTKILNGKLDELTDLLSDDNVGKLTPDQCSDLITETEQDIQKAQHNIEDLKTRLKSVESYTKEIERETAAWNNDLKTAPPLERAESDDATTTASTSAATAPSTIAANEIMVENSMEIVSCRIPLDMSSYSHVVESAFSSGKPTKKETGTKKKAGTTKKTSPAKRSSSSTAKKTSGSSSRKSSPAKKSSSSSDGSRSASAAKGAAGSASSRGSSPTGGNAPGAKEAEELKTAANALMQSLTAAVEAYPISASSPQQTATIPTTTIPTVESAVASTASSSAPRSLIVESTTTPAVDTNTNIATTASSSINNENANVTATTTTTPSTSATTEKKEEPKKEEPKKEEKKEEAKTTTSSPTTATTKKEEPKKEEAKTTTTTTSSSPTTATTTATSQAKPKEEISSSTKTTTSDNKQEEPKKEEEKKEEPKKEEQKKEEEKKEETQQVSVTSPAITTSSITAAVAVAVADNKEEEADSNSWTSQRKKLLSDHDSQHETPSEEYREVWERFAHFAEDSNKALIMYHVYKHAKRQQEEYYGGYIPPAPAPTATEGAAGEQQPSSASASNALLQEDLVTRCEKYLRENLDNIIERIQFARQHPELTKMPPPAPVVVSATPEKAGKTSKKAGSRSTSPAKKTAGSRSPSASAKKTSSSSSTTGSAKTKTATTAKKDTSPKRSSSTTAKPAAKRATSTTRKK